MYAPPTQFESPSMLPGASGGLGGLDHVERDSEHPEDAERGAGGDAGGRTTEDLERPPTDNGKSEHLKGGGGRDETDVDRDAGKVQNQGGGSKEDSYAWLWDWTNVLYLVAIGVLAWFAKRFHKTGKCKIPFGRPLGLYRA